MQEIGTRSDRPYIPGGIFEIRAHLQGSLILSLATAEQLHDHELLDGAGRLFDEAGDFIFASLVKTPSGEGG